MTPCIFCHKPAYAQPSICPACAAERAEHRAVKAILRAAEYRARMTKGTTR